MTDLERVMKFSAMQPHHEKKRLPVSDRQLFNVQIDISEKRVMVIWPDEQDPDLLSGLVRTLRKCTDHLSIHTRSNNRAAAIIAAETGARLCVREYNREDLYGADMVILGGCDRALNDEVFAACRTLGIRLSILTEPGRSDFICA